ncbi:MAG: hypothetical protein ABI616_13275 [Pseudomonadota bacterium]
MKHFVLVAAFAGLASTAQGATCSRAQLTHVVDNYFKVVETHKMSNLKTTKNLRITENGQDLQSGEGLLKSGGKTLLRRDVIDTERCATVSEAVTQETIDGTLTQAVMAVRLQLDGKKVSEIETLVTREKEQKTFYNPKALLATADQDWRTPLPAAARKSRAYMNDVANKYFSAFTKDKVEDGPYAEVCHRWEGGLQTTAKNGKCSPQGTGLFINHTHRRFPVTDTELGITAGFMNFGGALPDVHIFKFNEKGEVYLINAVFGGRLQGDHAVWPDDSK